MNPLVTIESNCCGTVAAAIAAPCERTYICIDLSRKTLCKDIKITQWKVHNAHAFHNEHEKVELLLSGYVVELYSIAAFFSLYFSVVLFCFVLCKKKKFQQVLQDKCIKSKFVSTLKQH